MKKVFNVLALGTVALAAGAQQLPNPGFEGSWVDSRPWNTICGTELTMREGLELLDQMGMLPEGISLDDPYCGQQPEGWVISNVLGVVSPLEDGSGWGALGTTLVGRKVAGNGSESAVMLANNPNPFLPTQIVPGYITLGTAWATNTLDFTTFSPVNKDGGTFGGLAFTARPDALAFDYMLGLGEGAEDTDRFTVMAYTWKGTWSQADVPGNNSMSDETVKTTMKDRDRNILGIETAQGGEVTHSDDALLISKAIEYITPGAEGWSSYLLPLEYFSEVAPEKLNVIISSNDIFDTENIRLGNSITVDNIRMVYFSRLAGLNVGGVEIAKVEDGVYDYTVAGVVPAIDAVEAVLLGGGKTAVADMILEGNVLKVTVNNAVGADFDGKSSHTYTFTFSGDEARTYPGYLNIEMLGAVVAENQEATIEIIDNGDNTCTFRLPDFSFDMGAGPMLLGDIVVENVTMTDNGDGSTLYEGGVEGLELLGGMIVADVTLKGTIKDNVVDMKIDVLWGETPVNVTFTTDKKMVGIGSVEAGEDAEAVYYNLSGVRMQGDNLPAGLYIRRQGDRSEKVMVR